jgi:hypothetical protein
MTKDGAVFIKAKTKGEVAYPPFESLDDEIMRACQKFQVFPLGTVQDYPRSIPYHSGKKDFFEKTGREGFEGSIWPFLTLMIPADFVCSFSIHLQN